MVVHKDSGVNSAFALAHNLDKPFEEPGLIFVALEDSRSIDPAHHDVVKGTRNI